MRYWNSWGHDNTEKPPLTESALTFVRETLGDSQPLPEATLEEVCKQVPESRLPDHALIDKSAEVRVRHARGQSLPDWIAMKSGDFGCFPDGVACPETPEQIRELLELSREKDFIVIPYGGGTSVAGHINPQQQDKAVLTLSLERMTRLLDLNEESQIATFGPGTPGPMVEAQLASRGYTLGHYPQSFELSTIGGWVASRSSGQQSLRYGRIEQMFAGGRLETFDGTMDIPTIPASSAGPDLREVVLGSEGRFGVISEVKVRVTRAPEKEEFIVVYFPNWEKAYQFCREATQQKIQLSMLRASNAVETWSQLKLAGHDDLVAWLERYLRLRGVDEGKCMVTFGITGNKIQVMAARGQVHKLIRSYGGVGMTGLGPKVGRLWEKGRFRYPYLRENLWKHGYAVDTLETSVNWDKTNTTIDGIENSLRTALEDEGEVVHCFTHLSHVYTQGSSIYTTYLFRMGKTHEETLARWNKLKKACSIAVVEHGGTISHQHGVGRDHAPYLKHEKGPLGMAALYSLSEHFDPDQRLNPGGLLEEITENEKSTEGAL
ncbi:FAD-binding oxidoreductase [Parendozoicomonas haliclonae]|uniref:Putative FAD-linked oxidoreductase n=1 Tax=Parendozoicomonas haliclonae TaxID=1960125 RepID=A0A1X7AN47_9GAMM|nr:FAD-binding oxidoreductase [Parendozoicomonas haliclonae]SMA49532.1 putative FAD-linked oxidoreductase [Parendozoicomonas haliclonae]